MKLVCGNQGPLNPSAECWKGASGELCLTGGFLKLLCPIRCLCWYLDLHCQDRNILIFVLWKDEQQLKPAFKFWVYRGQAWSCSPDSIPGSSLQCYPLLCDEQPAQNFASASSHSSTASQSCEPSRRQCPDCWKLKDGNWEHSLLGAYLSDEKHQLFKHDFCSLCLNGRARVIWWQKPCISMNNLSLFLFHIYVLPQGSRWLFEASMSDEVV